MTEQPTIEEIETELMIKAVHMRYGHDFNDYSRSSLIRRFSMLASKYDFPGIAEMIPGILKDRALWEQVFSGISVTVSEFFRDPEFFQSLKATVIPVLRTYPRIRIWHAGCATGEEVFSLAILLHEAGLLDRCTIFATDFNDAVLQRAKLGVFDMEKVEEGIKGYDQVGGVADFLDYFVSDGESARIRSSLLKHITFANHNLVVDKQFAQMHLIVCRNVLIYFNRDLQERVLRLFLDSLVQLGWMGLGSRESIAFSGFAGKFEAVDRDNRVFRKAKEILV